MKDIFKLLRLQHWIKNGLLFLPVIFHGSLVVSDYLITFLGWICFSLMSSAVYIINDIRDIEKDRKHERKKNRPLASGRVSIQKAAAIAVLLIVVSVLFNLLTAEEQMVSTLYLLLYLGINVLYSFGLKDKAIVDVVILATGFVIRVLYGGALTSTPASPILILTVMSFALYMGLGKRRNEKRKVKENTREVLEYYTDEFLDKNMYMCLSLGIVFYSIWTLSAGDYVVYTVAIVLIICMRYNLIIERESYGDPVEVLCSDKMLIGLVIVFVICLLFALCAG